MLNLGKGDPYYHGRPQADTVAVLKLVASAEQHFTIPAGATIMVVSFTPSTGDVYLLTNGQTATIPAASSTSFPAPNTNPEVVVSGSVYNVKANNLCSVISSSTPIVTLMFYADSAVNPSDPNSPVTGP